MPRTHEWRDEAAAGLVLRHLQGLAVRGTALVMEDARPDVRDALRRAGVEARTWHRRGGAGRSPSPWPPDGPFDVVFLRLPRAREELEMNAHAAAARLRPSGALFVYGAKDEGAGSAARRLEPLYGVVGSVATGNRCRIVEARDPDRARARGRIEDWRCTHSPPVPDLGPRPWISYPGMFAHGRLDDGTALLLETLSSVASRARVLDFGCGDGVLGAAVLARAPETVVTLLDVDALALAAAAENVPGADLVLGDGLACVAPGAFDLIVSNPPFHRSRAETLSVVRRLVAAAPSRLASGGEFRMVVQRRLPVEAPLRAAFPGVRIVADRGPFRVWSATRPSTPSSPS